MKNHINSFGIESLIKQVNVQSKLLILFVFSILFFLLDSVSLYCFSMAIIIFLYPIIRLHYETLRSQIRSASYIFVIVLISHAISNTIVDGIDAALRCGVLILLSSVIMITTKISEFIDALELILKPFSRVLQVKKVSLAFALAIRFIPLIAEVFRETKAAQTSRGLERNFIAIIVPATIKVLKMADSISEAIEARSWSD